MELFALVQTALVFLLGFFCAGFLAFAAAPHIWRRAAQLTQARIEASSPLTLNEVQADKDQQRAEFAMALRRAQIKTKSVNEERIAHMANAATARETLRIVTLERDGLAATVLAHSADLLTLTGEISVASQSAEALQAERDTLQKSIGDAEREIAVRDNVIGELKIDADHKRIEYVARVTEREDIKVKVHQLIQVRKTLEEKVREGTADVRTMREAARVSAKKILELERRNERLMSRLSDAEERLERRGKELERAQQVIKAGMPETGSTKARPESVALAQRVGIHERMKSSDAAGKPVAADRAQSDKSKTDKPGLRRRKVQLDEEGKALALQVRSLAQDGAKDAQLRTKIREFTAKIVSFTAETEGSVSPINALVHNTQSISGASDVMEGPADEMPDSLAERIIALQSRV